MSSLSSDTLVLLQRKLAALQMDAKTTAAVEEKEVLWRVNFEEFLRRLRHRVWTYSQIQMTSC
jgi:hypothetical protein